MLLARVLQKVVKQGDLTLIGPDGRDYRFGDGAGDPVRFQITTRAAAFRMALNPKRAFGEAYMNGTLVPVSGTVFDLLNVLTANLGTHGRIPYQGVVRGLEWMFRMAQQFNPVGRSERNVRHHYDLSGDLYQLFLDRDRQYSCAVFPFPGADLDLAQTVKKELIAAKLQIRPGDRVLDIGCGWGGMALHIARSVPDTEVVGVTLSKEQHAYAVARAKTEGLADRVSFRVQDYRAVEDRFDRIVSVGMFEHVGVPHYRAFFEKVHGLLKDDGIALLHSIGRMDGPGTTNAFIRKYIFPGGYSPALSEVFAAVEQSGLWVTDLEILRLHYAETLRHWRHRFLDQWDRAAALYDEEFCRMWEFYLAGSECAFRNSGHMVMQVQLTRDVGAVPLTRDYLYRETEKIVSRARHAA